MTEQLLGKAANNQSVVLPPRSPATRAQRVAGVLGVKGKKKKSYFFQDEVKFLDHKISTQRYRSK